MIERWIRCRYILAVLLTLGMMNAFIMRVNMSVAIVAMVEAPEKETIHAQECVVEDADNNGSYSPTNSSLNNEKPFKWDAQTRGWILSAFYYGYITTPLLGGWLEYKFGAKIVFGLSLLLSSIITLLIPTASYLGPLALVIARICLGIVQGPVYPSHHGMWSRWAPPSERSSLMSVAMAGPEIGVALSYIASGYLSESGFLNGWPSIFYLTGAIGIIWSIFWAIFAFDSPETHPRITDEERNYLKRVIGKEELKMKTPPIPWGSILRSPQVWSLFFAHFCFDWVFRNFAINLPSFMDQVLGIDIKNNSILSAIPFIAESFCIVLSGWVVDKVRKRECMTALTFKRIMIFFAQIVPAALLIGVGHVGCNQIAAVIILTVISGLSGLCTPSILVNFAEIAPMYAGVLFGMSNSTSILSGMLCPILAGYVTGSVSDLRLGWQIVFYVAACFSVLGGTIFMFTVRVNVQSWAKISTLDSTIDEKHKPVEMRALKVEEQEGESDRVLV